MKTIREMLESGMTREQIIALVNDEATNYEKEKAAADNKALNEARGFLADAIIDYVNALGIIDYDVSDEEIDEIVKDIENILSDFEEETVAAFKRIKKMDKFMEKIKNETGEKEPAANKKMTDDDILKAFIRSL